MPHSKILVGDVRTRLAEIPDDSIQSCITSPPYWGLRDYGHDGQIGLEQTPDEYVMEMVAVFREVRRVLKDDGVLWLNLGDSYWNNFGGGSGTMTTGNAEAVRQRGRHNKPKHELFKIKDLVGIPWRVAFALQADGWWLRQDIIWHKPNPMPESVTDRCTKSHEYLFMLTKSAKYYFDNKAIKEPVAASSLARAEYGWDCDRPSTKNASMGGQGIHVEKMGTRFVNPEGRNKRSVWTISTRPFKGAHFAVMPEALVEPCILATSKPDDTVLDPFTGSGTVAVVALRHARNFIGTELNPEYANIAQQRINESNPLFNTVELR
jgi:DNA modification methylase